MTTLKKNSRPVTTGLLCFSSIVAFPLSLLFEFKVNYLFFIIKWKILVPQLIHVVSCGWWRGDGGFMWGYPSTNHNSPHGRVVAQVVVLELLLLNKRVAVVVGLMLFLYIGCTISQYWTCTCAMTRHYIINCISFTFIIHKQKTHFFNPNK